MPSQSMIRSIKIFLITATFLGCSLSSFSQQSIPPIDMTLTEFNQGRPANFYYLADATEGYEAVCDEVLEALNEPYPGEAYAEYVERYSKYLLRSRLSVPWVEMPFETQQNKRNPYLARHITTDLNNDGKLEDIFVRPMYLTGNPVHYFTIVDKGLLPSGFQAVSPEMWIVIRDSGGRIVGDALANRIRAEVSRVNEEPGVESPHVQESSRAYFDVIELSSSRYILRTYQSSPEHQKDTYLFLWSADDSLQSLCRFRSWYTIEN